MSVLTSGRKEAFDRVSQTSEDKGRHAVRQATAIRGGVSA